MEIGDGFLHSWNRLGKRAGSTGILDGPSSFGFIGLTDDGRVENIALHVVHLPAAIYNEGWLSKS